MERVRPHIVLARTNAAQTIGAGGCDKPGHDRLVLRVAHIELAPADDQIDVGGAAMVVSGGAGARSFALGVLTTGKNADFINAGLLSGYLKSAAQLIAYRQIANSALIGERDGCHAGMLAKVLPRSTHRLDPPQLKAHVSNMAREVMRQETPRAIVDPRIHEPEFLWPGAKPDVEDWDENFPEKLGRGILSAWQKIVLYYGLPGAIIPASLLPTAIVLLIYEAAGFENGDPTMVFAATTVGLLCAIAWGVFVIREWRRYGFLRRRWPLSRHRERQ